MQIQDTQLEGVRLIALAPRGDERGYFVRTYCEETFAAQGLNTHWPQANHTRTRDRGMLRGLHWQAPPRPEIKLVRCTAGRIWDVVVDVRRDRPSFGRWQAFELDASGTRQLYIPAGFAHGYQTLTDGCEVTYLMGASYEAGLARGVRWDDPDLDLPWPIRPVLPEWLSARDRELPRLAEVDFAR